MKFCRSCRLRRGWRSQAPTDLSSGSTPTGNGRSALFSIPTCRRSFLRSLQRWLRRRRPLSRPPQRWPKSRLRHAGCRHLRSSSRPNQGSRNRNPNARSQKPALPPQWLWSRNNPDLAFLATTPGRPRLSISRGQQRSVGQLARSERFELPTLGFEVRKSISGIRSLTAARRAHVAIRGKTPSSRCPLKLAQRTFYPASDMTALCQTQTCPRKHDQGRFFSFGLSFWSACG